MTNANITNTLYLTLFLYTLLNEQKNVANLNFRAPLSCLLTIPPPQISKPHSPPQKSFVSLDMNTLGYYFLFISY